LRVTVASTVKDIPASEWNRCARSATTPYSPLIDHAFFHALEASLSAVRATGWLGHHLLLEGADGKLAGVAPCYVKVHSQGEYVFDYAWADAYQRAGGRYYPKLQMSVPFTPVTGRRLLVPDGSSADRHRMALLQAAKDTCTVRRLSSIHVTFPTEEEWRLFTDQGFLARTDIQFHWFNKGYGSFDDFLADLASSKRKNLRKERQLAREEGIVIDWVTGEDIQEHHWDSFFEFYMDTGSRKWGTPYLTREFFSLIGASLAQHILLVMCRRGRRYIAGALNFIGGDTLYGRNWGAIEHHPFLHFEACYYQAIEFAIARKLRWVEAGAQGPHKLARGYLPKLTHSAHYFSDDRLARAVSTYLRQERAAISEGQAELAGHSPFRQMN
jgi:predicted N-acyltransferase